MAIALSDPDYETLRAAVLSRVVPYDVVYGSLYAALRASASPAVAMRVLRVSELTDADLTEAQVGARVGVTARQVRRDLRLVRSAFQSRRECCK